MRGFAAQMRRRLPRLETALVVGLALLVVIKGFGAAAGVFSGVGQMIRDLWSVLVAWS